MQPTSNHNIPTITVVMPVYNVSAYVERCLLSVMRQKKPADECIIVDDASPDDSIAKCERLIAEYTGPTRFNILHHKEQRGLSAARNTGTDAATSDYIYYLDSDDEMTIDCLEKLSKPLLNDDSIEMVMGNNIKDRSKLHLSKWQQFVVFNYDNWIEDTPAELYTNEDLRKWFFKGKHKRPPYVWNKLLKLDFIKSHQLYNKDGLLYEDRLWSYYLMRHLNHAAFVKDVTYLYHLRPDSIVTSTKYEDILLHRGLFYVEYAKNVVSGENIEEAEFYSKGFCDYYVDAHYEPNYQYAYKIFHRELSDGHHRKMLFVLSLTHHLGKNNVGRQLFKFLRQTHALILRIYR